MIGVGLAILAQLSVTVVAPDSMRAHTTDEVRIHVIAPRGRNAALVAPSFRPFVVVRMLQSSHVDPAYGGRFVADYRYTIAAPREGNYVLGPFVARAGALVDSSPPQHVIVVGAPQGSRVPSVVTRATIDTAMPVTFRALVAPETVYVGQQATYELGVFLEESVRDRLRRMEAIAPEMRGLMAYDAPLPVTGFPPRIAGGRRYESHVYERPIFPLAPGRYVLAPARLIYAMPLTYSFFSREESFELRSDTVTIVALDPPAASRPSDFSGAVGQLSIAARVDSSGARVGNPLELTVRVSGVGNVKLFPRPALMIPWANVLASGEAVELDSDSLRIHGTKNFTYLVTPLKPGAQTIPPVRYSYFDPLLARYTSAESNAIPLLIASGTLATPDSAPSSTAPRLALRDTYRGELDPPLYARHDVWWALAALPFPALVLQLARRPRRRRQPRAARRLRALTNGEGLEAARDARRAFVEALSERLGIAASALAEPATLERLARRSGASAETAQRAAAVLVELDSAAFAAAPSVEPDVAREAYRAYLAIDRESRRAEDNASATIAMLVVALLAGATVVRGAAPPPGDALFVHGGVAYAAGRFADAEAAFRAVTAAAPHAPDAWANFGTAAWAASDTGNAVNGWEHALRLEPTASDMRERLDRVPTLTDDPLATVPPMDPAPLAVAAALVWCLTWLFVAFRPRSSQLRARTVALVGSSAAALLAAAVFSLDTSLAATDLAVLEQPSSLRATASAASERGQVLGPGSVVRVQERGTDWAHVSIDSERDGWIDTAALLPLARSETR